MSESEELKKIKKIYGEKMMHLCRELFPSLLEYEGRVYEVLSSNFSENCRSLYDDLIAQDKKYDFKNFVYSCIDVESEEKRVVSNRTPYELLNEAGYDLYECHTEEDIQNFKKYYAPKEELCTFKGGRLDRCVVFFAVRKDVDKIRREDFKNPKREDEYGTSVMSIQFEKEGKCIVSIKNRYNHTVNNPDATYGNNLEQIIPGLTKSFERLLTTKGLVFEDINMSSFELDNYIRANDGLYYKYNIETNGNYYCPDNIMIKNGRPIKLDRPESQILADYYIFDTVKKEIRLADEGINDSFPDTIKDIEKMEIRRDNESKDGSRIIIIKQKGYDEPVIIKINKNNQITEYINNNVRRIDKPFMNKCYFEIENGVKVVSEFALTKVIMNNLEVAPHHFLEGMKIRNANFPSLRKIGENVLSFSEIEEINLPRLETIGNNFLFETKKLNIVNLPSAKEIGRNFGSNSNITYISCPELLYCDYNFCCNAKKLENVYLPKLQKTENHFLFNTRIKKVDFRDLVSVGPHAFSYCDNLEVALFPSLKNADFRFYVRM